jgi:hypothetical protein
MKRHRKPMIVAEPIWAIARDEADRWDIPRGLVIAILFCFIHRLTTGETFEQTFCRESDTIDYQI